MPYTQQPHDTGIPSYRDEDYKNRGWSLGARWTTWAHGIKKIQEDGTVDRNKTHGDILGSVFVKPESRHFGSWFHACPAIKVDGAFYPIRDKTFAPDTSFSPIDASTINGAEVPNGVPCIILCATKEDGEQELIVMSAGSGTSNDFSLIAANRNGPYEFGSSVFDLNANGEPDPSKQAKLQSAWKVMTPSYTPTSGSTSSNGNFFNLAAQAKNIPAHDDQRTLLKVTKPKGNKNTIQVGILKDGSGGLTFKKNGKEYDPFGGYFGTKNQGDQAKLKTKNTGNPNQVSVGVGVQGGINIGAPEQGGTGSIGLGGAGGFGSSKKITT